ncbi:hypothetical protein EMIT047CA2_80262 [Pseudomonas soli]
MPAQNRTGALRRRGNLWRKGSLYRISRHIGKFPERSPLTRKCHWKSGARDCYKGNPTRFHDSFTLPSAPDYCAVPPPKITSVPT